MHASDQPDPWSSLAETLGVGPGGEPQRQPSTPPPARPAPPRSAERPKQKPATPPPASWDDLASDLGIAPAAGEPPPRRDAEPRRPVAEPPRRGEERPRRDDRRVDDQRHEERRRPPLTVDSPAAREGGPADAEGGDAGGRGARDARDEQGDERGGRRRRGRRGGRGRRDRDGADAARRDEGRDGGAPARGPGERGEWSDERPRPIAERPAGDEAADGRRGDGEAGAPAVAGDEDRPRRRRRRGRRGGRGRSRSDLETGDARVAGGEPGRGPEAAGADRLDDEPVPTSYGMQPPARTPGFRDSAGSRRGDGSGARPAAGEDGDGSSRGRRRRRRRGGEGRAQTGDRPARESGRGRRSRRGGDERTVSSRSARVRRADFAPVAGTYDEDDEGLEFLGVEEAGREPGRRESRPEDDDVLAESGLNTVRDVPSWVEAIGIVIAGNLDARTRGRGEGGRSRDR